MGVGPWRLPGLRNNYPTPKHRRSFSRLPFFLYIYPMTELLHHTAIWTFLLAWVWTEIDEIQQVLAQLQDYCYSKLPYYIYNPLALVFILLQCFKCLTFWTTLLFTFDIVTSLILAFIASWYEQRRS